MGESAWRFPAAPSECGGCAASPVLPGSVDLSTGEVLRVEEDLRVPGLGLDFVWSRTYRSGSRGGTVLGLGWDHAYNLRLERSGDGLLVHTGDASATRLVERPGGRLELPDAFAYADGATGDAGLTLTFPSGGTWRFRPLDDPDAPGAVDRISDRNNNALSFVYDGALVQIIDTIGRRFRLDYDDGRLRSLTDPAGRVVSYEFSHGALATVTLPGEGARVTYGYRSGLLHTATNRRGQRLVRFAMTKGTKANPARLSAYWDGANANPTHISYERSDEGGASVAVVNDAIGNVREYSFDGSGRCVRVRAHELRADPAMPTTAGTNRPQRVVRPGAPPFHDTAYRYNDDGLVTRVVSPDGGVTERVYEGDEDPSVPLPARVNLRRLRQLPGPAGADQQELVTTFRYADGLACSCDEEFVVERVDPDGRSERAGFDDRGNLTSLDRLDRTALACTYGEQGQLVDRIENDGGGPRRDRFDYYEEGDRRYGLLRTETLDADGSAATTTYDYDVVGRLIAFQDPEGGQHEQAWNDADDVVRRRGPELEDGRRRVEVTGHDPDRNPVSFAVGWAAGGASAEKVTEVIRRAYDPRGKLVEAVVPAGPGDDVVTRHAWDANGNRVGTTWSGGGKKRPERIVTIEYDALDRPMRRVDGLPDGPRVVVAIEHDGGGRRTRVVRGEGSESAPTEIRHDGFGRTVSVHVADGPTQAVRYDASHNVVEEVLTAGDRSVRVLHEYDGTGRRVLRRTQGEEGASEERWEYDDASRAVTHVATDGRLTRVERDSLGRVVASGRTRYRYDQNSNLVEEAVGPHRVLHERDADGNARRVLYADGTELLRQYDARGLPIAYEWPDGSRNEIEFDGAGRPTRLRVRGRAGESIDAAVSWNTASLPSARTDPNGNTTRHIYDPAGNLTALHYPDGTHVTRTFDTRGNCTGWTDANGTVVDDELNRLDRVVRRTVRPGPQVAADTTLERYEYDAFGRIVRAENDATVTTWRYDAIGRTIAEEQQGLSVRTVYADQGGARRVTYPSGVALDVALVGEDLRVSGPGGAVADVGRGLTRFLSTGAMPIETSTQFDQRGLPARRTTDLGDETIDSRQFEWDARSNLVAEDVRGLLGARSARYRVDAASRLRASHVHIAGSEGRTDTEYELDDAGNRSGLRVGGKLRRYASRGKVFRARNQYSATPNDKRRYDTTGNLVETVDAHGRRRTMRYDYRNRMVALEDERSGVSARYVYDCVDRRLAKSVEGPAGASGRAYSFDGEHVVEDRPAGGGPGTAIAWAGDRPIALFGAGGPQWLLPDLLGSIVGVLDRDGSLVQSMSYGDFGEPRLRSATGEDVGTGDAVSPVLFAGYQYDAESGFYYLRTRYLEPGTGRFTTPDPGGTWYDGYAVGNGYAYASNNPLVGTDPSGMSVTRNIACNGPSPGPRTITVEYEGCSSARRQANDVPVCRAFRASGQSNNRLINLWMQTAFGVAIPGTGTTRAQVAKWFGGPDGATNANSQSIISNRLGYVFGAIKSDDFDIDCESGCDAGVNAYVNYGGWDVNLCGRYFTAGFSQSKQASILIHELTHAYGDTDDYFYYSVDGNNMPFNALFETTTLRWNADSYEQFTLEFFLP